MSRLTAVMMLEARSTFRQPTMWLLIGVVAFSALPMSELQLDESGDPSVGGAKLHITSEFAIAYVMPLFVLGIYSLFAALAAGMAVIRDDDLAVSELLMSTPLRAREYIWGKFLGVLLAFVAVLTFHMFLMVVVRYSWPLKTELRGPFALVNYLRPMLLLCLPLVIFLTSMPFAIGTVARRSLLTWFFPMVALAGTAFLLGFRGPWLDPFWDRVLTVVEPTAVRWLNATWVDVDRGVDFYNNTPVGLDGTFAANRAFLLFAGLAAVFYAQRRFAMRLKGPGVGRLGSLSRRLQRPRKPLAKRVGLEDTELSQTGFRSGFFTVTRFELRELATHPGLYIAALLIMFLAASNAAELQGPFGAPLLLSSGVMALGVKGMLTALVILLLAFFTVESLQREHVTGIGPIFYSASVPSGAVLFGKALANAVLGILVVGGAVAGCWIFYLIEPADPAARPPFELWPFALVWGVFLFPTFFIWTSFISVVQVVGRNRYLTYGVALAALFLTIYVRATGRLTWAWDWSLSSSLRWSDMGTFELNRTMLAWNRVGVLTAAIALTVAGVRFFARRDRDSARLLQRFHPKAARSLLALAPLLLPPVVIGGWLYREVLHGFQGPWAVQRDRDYWRRNLATHRGTIDPLIVAVDLEVEIEPGDHWFRVDGRYRLVNRYSEPMPQILLTPGAWEDLRWSLNGLPFEPVDRAGLAAFQLPQPLAPEEEAVVGFSYHGTLPAGATRNGGGAMHFVLPSGVVLDDFTNSFVPMVGYRERIGVGAENRYEPPEVVDDFHVGVLPPAEGRASLFSTRIAVTGPEDYTFNSVGVLKSDQRRDGRRTVVWVSDHPVRAFNVVGGRWHVARRDGTAIFYHPEHSYNIDEMSGALAAAKRHYSEWFHPFAWAELKLSEFPNLARYARAFATNIAFSEDSGFITRSDPTTNAAFVATAHEASHQWWGNLLTPGEGPGSGVLVEGMANFSTMLLVEAVKGRRDRIEFCKRREESYGSRRLVDAERPMVKTDLSRAGDDRVIYDKGAWVSWMLMQQLGREAMLEGLREFIRRYKDGPDYPALQDYVAVLREFSTDPEAFDEFVDQWFFDVVVPEYRFSDVELAGENDAWVVRAVVTNHGSGRMPVEVALTAGKRFEDDGGESDDYREIREQVALGAGESLPITLQSDFEPDAMLVDPDVVVLQLQRDRAVHRF